jgi:hypothetical protein
VTECDLRGGDGLLQIPLALRRFQVLPARLADALLFSEPEGAARELVALLLRLALKLTAGGLSVWLTRPLWPPRLLPADKLLRAERPRWGGAAVRRVSGCSGQERGSVAPAPDGQGTRAARVSAL